MRRPALAVPAARGCPCGASTGSLRPSVQGGGYDAAVPRLRGAQTGLWCALVAFAAAFWPAATEGAATRPAGIAHAARRGHARRHHAHHKRRHAGRRHRHHVRHQSVRSVQGAARSPRRTRSTPQSRTCANADVVPGAASVATVERATLCLVNNERRAHGVAPLTDSAPLGHAATGYSLAMVKDDFFSDVSPSGTTVGERIARSGYRATAPRARPAQLGRLAENLAVGCGSLATPASIVRTWMESPPHRANLLGRGFRASGIGVALGVPSLVANGWSGPAATYTQYFASSR